MVKMLVGLCHLAEPLVCPKGSRPEWGNLSICMLMQTVSTSMGVHAMDITCSIVVWADTVHPCQRLM